MADRKDKPKWSKPKLSPTMKHRPAKSKPNSIKMEKRPMRGKVAEKRPPYKDATTTMRANRASATEGQRRGMAATRKKAAAKRPNRPITLAELQAVRRLDKDRFQDSLMSSPVARRARERFRMEGR